jgi:hypothetical protein
MQCFNIALQHALDSAIERIYFFMQCFNIALQHALDSPIERKIVFTRDVCSRTPLLLGLTISMQMTLEGPWVR